MNTKYKRVNNSKKKKEKKERKETWQFESEDLESKPTFTNNQQCDFMKRLSLSFLKDGR